MAKKNSEYWKKRFTLLEDAANKKGQAYYADLEKQYAKAQRTIDAKIQAWYGRLADNNNVTMAEARKLLTSNELKEFKWDVKEYIKYGEINSIDTAWMKQLENASSKFHISRLEALKIQTQQTVEELYGNQVDGIDQLARSVYTNGYYHTAYEIQKGFNVGYDISGIDKNKLDKIISSPWAADGKNFSSRVWDRRSTMVSELHTQLTQTILTGKAPDEAIKNLSKFVDKKFKNAKVQAGKLVMTESAYFSSAAQKDAFNELDVEKFEIVATLDSHTSEICQGLDGQVFVMKDYEPGVTAPPFHVWCRSTTVPWFEDNYGGERAARGEDGKTYYVPDDMKYADWHNEYVKNNPKAELAEKKIQNLVTDKEQYENYKSVLGKEYLPPSLDEFQNVKYNDATEYGILKSQVKGMSYYNKATINEPDISSTIKKVADDIDVDVLGFEYKVKSKDSYLRKIRSNYSPDGNEYEINDILRYTYGSTVNKLADKTIDSIEKYSELSYNTIKVKNSWLDDTNPYKGINTIIQAPNGQKFEMQYHTQESFDLKNGQLHELYEKQRLIKDEESEEFIILKNQMFELSDKLTIPIGIERVE